MSGSQSDRYESKSTISSTNSRYPSVVGCNGSPKPNVSFASSTKFKDNTSSAHKVVPSVANKVLIRNAPKITSNKLETNFSDNNNYNKTSVNKISDNLNKSLNSKSGLAEQRKPRKLLIRTQNKSTSKPKERPLFKARSDGYPCGHCGRYFNAIDRLEKHQSICEVISNKERPAYDSTKQRFKGQPNEYLHFYRKSINQNEPTDESKKWNWRQKHEYCLASIRSAKDDPSGPTTWELTKPTLKQCNYCKRLFNDDAIKRHLPICSKLYHKKLLSY
ncbi:uncharacterized protein LOC128957840 [Oppia nitens]|uniref:uncharacterized protein LOC128957840 n=1 Tax=Oppia nitens TaxID=1686743 RepID=UPI0023DCB75E|nr:uncharacterized protein LOC128957840 [Oppia nitens]